MGDKAIGNKLCFVIGPIGDPGTEIRRDADWLLKGIIKQVFDQHFPEYYVQRADEISEPGSINSQVITRLLDAPLVIADMSRHNANAFYELAVRHMVQLPTIHVIHSDWKVPFDVMPYRAIPFSRDRIEDYQAAIGALKAAVDEAVKPGFRAENPITHARGRIELERHATPDQKVLLEQLTSIQNRLASFERSSRLRPSGFYGGGDFVPLATSIITFMSKSTFPGQQADAIHRILAEQYPGVVKIAQSLKEVTFAFPGEVNESEITLPPGLMASVTIVPHRLSDPGSY